MSDELIPPFCRLDRGSELARCDFIDFISDAETCCDEYADYRVRWKLMSCDLDTPQESNVCKAHIDQVPRGQVQSMETHPRLLASVGSQQRTGAQ